jgi:6-phosphogluconolactonase (cycloisomerase 2 family)
MLWLSRYGSIFVVLLGMGLLGATQLKNGEGRLTLVESVPRDELDAVVSVATSRDGKFHYAAAWRSATLTVFARDPKTGKLEPKQTITDQNVLAGTTSLNLSPDGGLAVAAAFQSRTVVLYTRSAETGELARSDVAREGEKELRMQFPIAAAFSPDSKFVYVVDDSGPGDGGQGGITAFRVNDGKLELVGTDEGKDGCYAGARGLAFHPDGKTLFVACNRAGTLVVADRDGGTGKTSVRQVIKDEEGDVHGLAGAMGVVVSANGRFAYVSSGRFRGDDAVSVFQVGAGGRLILVQEFLNGKGELQSFEGGNQLAVSPDGLNVYAAATRSRTVACFRRHQVSGRLTFLETIPDGGKGGEFGAAGVTLSPDGQFVYVATEDGKAVSVFKRDIGHLN